MLGNTQNSRHRYAASTSGNPSFSVLRQLQYLCELTHGNSFIWDASAVAINAFASMTVLSVVRGIALAILASRCSVYATAGPPLAFIK
ncbi:hypothetical protein KPHVMX_730014 [Klebsiella pneumoniae]|nr:hypothetical protein KPHVMX_730014 [Klebsiella pneumoniae]